MVRRTDATRASAAQNARMTWFYLGVYTGVAFMVLAGMTTITALSFLGWFNICP